jgi:hypothetical protein
MTVETSYLQGIGRGASPRLVVFETFIPKSIGGDGAEGAPHVTSPGMLVPGRHDGTWWWQ